MISGLIARARSLWRGVRGGSALGAEMDEEFRHHVELRTEDLVRRGMSRREAARRARIEFGSTERYKDEGRQSRGLRRFDDLRVSWLDFKLGFRMLAKYPGLTLVGGVAMAFAIWLGAGMFEIVTQVVSPRLPLPDGSRVVGLFNFDVSANRKESRTLSDFVTWREQMRTVQDLGAVRTLERNLITGEGQGEPVEVAEISASAFRVTLVPPLLGRGFVEADERPGAPNVVVIGHDVWQARFAGDSGVVGRTVRLGSAPSTVVGVMPPGFAFPSAQSLWVPLRLNVLDYKPREGPRLAIFGRLAPGATLDEAQTELTTIGRRAAADSPETHEHLRPTVMKYAQSFVNLPEWALLAVLSANIPVVLLVVLVCANVALLMFARAAARESELAVRSALGASRRRITMQLFAEALVLGAVAAVLGLAGARSGLRWVRGVVESEFMEGQRLPFWFTDRLSPATLLYAAGLTVLGAVIAGVVPALKVTGRGVGARLRQATAGGGGLQFGGVWTAVIIIQIAVTVAFPFTAFYTRRDAVQVETLDVGFRDDEFLSVRLEMDRESPSGAAADTTRAAFLARFETSYRELARRVEAEPGVAGVTFAERFPRMYHPHRLIEVDAGGAAPLHPQWPAYRVSSASVEPNFFDVLGVPINSGRGFQAADYAAERGEAAIPGGARGGVVIVNESFVKRVLGGRNPIGRRLRYTHFQVWDGSIRMKEQEQPGPWHEIVGVVRDMGMSVGEFDPKISGIYHPVAPGGIYPGRMAVHVRGNPMSIAPRLRAVATAVDPSLRLYDFLPLSNVNHAELEFYSFWVRMLTTVSAIALGLSLAAIYAVMAFTVARRTREIGIRVALGASPWRVATAIFRKPLTQVSLGILAGGILIGALLLMASGGNISAKGVATLVAYSAAMMAVCLLACIVPTRRALAVEPTEALRTDG